MRLLKYSFLIFWIGLLAGCDNLPKADREHNEDYNINIVNLEFEPGYKNFYANVKLDSMVSSMFLHRDSALNFKVSEFVGEAPFSPQAQPEFVDVKNMKLQELLDLHLSLEMVVDLTLSPEQVEEQRNTVERLVSILPTETFYVTFIKEKGKSDRVKLTDYVLKNYFKPIEEEKYFYRSIIPLLEAFYREDVPEEQRMVTDSSGLGFVKGQHVLVLMSDGRVYDDDNRPLDAEHFKMQRSMIELSDSMSHKPVIYINFKDIGEGSDLVYDSDNLMQQLCQKSGGLYFTHDDQYDILRQLLHIFDKGKVDLRFFFRNPDEKVYQGMRCHLQIDCFKGDSLLASDYIHYSLGTIYNPVIVNGSPRIIVIFQGLFVGVLLVLLIYIVFQFIVPYVGYVFFKRRYVTHYTGSNMTCNNILVPHECYYCKAPFEKGDEIVVKCKHVMHRDCWVENEYKCPEFGRNCKDGRHYYNKNNIYDINNTSPYFLWVLSGAFAGLVAWLFFTIFAFEAEGNYIVGLLPSLFDNIDAISYNFNELVEEDGGNLLYLPFYGFNICICLTFALSVLTSHGRWMGIRSVMIFCKTLVGGFLGWLSFYLVVLVALLFDLTDYALLMDWVPWLLSGYAITLTVTYGTDIKLKRAMMGATVSTFFGLGSMYLWSYSFDTQIDTRRFMLFSYMIYGVGFAASVAALSPKSERYFLRVEGPIKCMDIALYKWMNVSMLRKRVFIGKSVNCELQMTWDFTSNIAPIQAEICMNNGYVYLRALEEGVKVNDRELEVDVKKRLYHGSKFTIGKTIFTYLEKDV